MPLLRLENIKAGYNENIVLNGFSLEVNQGELVSFLGPSGCGKTTVLRIIAGFLTPNQGKVIFSNEDYTSRAVHKKNFGFVFQSYALFPHLSVFDNIAYGLKLRKINKAEIEKRVDEILNLVGLNELKKRYPRELSGGQQQRVALCRALVINPDLLLLDEPLSNLDAKLRVQMRGEIKSLQKRLGVTTIYVTHDQEECFAISDKIVVMQDGSIQQFDTPEKIFNQPKTEFVADFVGFKNFISLGVQGNHYVTSTNEKFEIDKDRIMSSAQNKKEIKGAIRPSDIKINHLKGGENKKDEMNVLLGEISLITYLGEEYGCVVSTNQGDLNVNFPADDKYREGEKVALFLPPEKIIGVN